MHILWRRAGLYEHYIFQCLSAQRKCVKMKLSQLDMLVDKSSNKHSARSMQIPDNASRSEEMSKKLNHE